MRKESLPWITTEIRKLINKKFRALKKYKTSKDRNDWELYKRLRNQVVRELRRAEAQHWITAFQKADCPKSFWGLVKKIQNKKRSQGIGALEVEGQIVTDPTAKAVALNNFFSNIGKNLAKKFETSTDTNKPPSCIYRVTPTINSFTLPDVSKTRPTRQHLSRGVLPRFDAPTQMYRKMTGSEYV